MLVAVVWTVWKHGYVWKTAFIKCMVNLTGEVTLKHNPKLTITMKRFQLFKHDSFKSHPRAKFLRLTIIYWHWQHVIM